LVLLLPGSQSNGELWGDMVRHVYAERRQFHSIKGLEEDIIVAWNEIPPDYSQNFV